MLQLTYISTAARDVDEQAVDAILASARRNNAAEGVTGLLLYDGKRFLQALEGDAERVNRIYNRIKADPRHRGLVLLSSTETDTRAFGDWSMAAQRVGVARGLSVVEQVQELTSDVADANIRELFRGFAKVRAAA
jgi:hypothetical protein